MTAPRVIIKEIDKSLYVETDSNFVVGCVHTFSKGPINERALVTNGDVLESTFGKPIDNGTHSQGFFALREYLRKGNQGYVVRVESAANPATAAKVMLRGTADDNVVTDTDGITSIPATRQLTNTGATDFAAAGVIPGDIVEVSGADAGFYVIVTVATVTITVDRDWPTGSGSGLTFTVWSSKREEGVDGATSVPASRTFTSAGSTFQTNGVAAGDILYINDTGDTGDNGFFTVESVTSETVLVVNRPFPEGSLSTLTFTLYGPNHPAGADGSTATDGEFVSASAMFQDHGVKAGDILVVEDTGDTGDNGTYLVTGLKTAAEDTTLEIWGDWPAGSLSGLSYRVLPGVVTLTPESKGSAYNGFTVQATASVALPPDLEFDLAIYDENSFLQESVVGMDLTTVVADMLAGSALFPTAVVIAGRDGPGQTYVATAYGGTDGTTGLVDSDLIGGIGEGMQLFKNKEEVTIDAIMCPGYTSQNIGDNLVAIAEGRGDCLALVDAPDSPTISTPAECVSWRLGAGGYGRTTPFNTSYAALCYSWQQINDNYHDTTRYTAPSGHHAAVIAQSENATFLWFAPAGLQRGKVSGASDSRYTNTDEGEQDYLYDNGVNPIVKFLREGIHVWGQKTLLQSTSALNRISARRMVFSLERNIAATVKSQVFEPADEATERELERLITPVMDYVLDNRGLNDYLLIFDTPDAIRQQNKLIGKIFLQPMPTAEVIELQFIVTALTVEFSELLAA